MVWKHGGRGLILTGKGEQTKTINKLQPGVECVGYAVGLSEDGKMNTEIESVDFWTQKAQTDKNGQQIEAVGDRIWWEIESVKNNSVALGRNFTSDGGRSHSWNEVGLANASVSSERRPVIERLVL